jgi:CDP-diacylglycerol---serine O-phosphatidyltransferase
VFNVAMLAVGMLLLAFLMVSTIKYPNFKKVGIPKSAFWITPLIVALVVVVAIKYPQQFPKIVFLPLAFYALYGIKKNVDLLVKKLRKKKESEEESLPFE